MPTVHACLVSSSFPLDFFMKNCCAKQKKFLDMKKGLPTMQNLHLYCENISDFVVSVSQCQGKRRANVSQG